MKELIECIRCIAKGLVDDPDAVRVDLGESGDVIELRVAPGDLGKVIGKNGRTADALRVILHAGAVKAGISCRLDIMDEGE